MREIAELPVPQASNDGRPARVCIVSSDLVGPVRNGGVGTAFTALAVALAEAGHKVTLLYVGGQFCENGRLEDWVMDYRRSGIEFVPMPDPTGPRPEGSMPLVKAYATYEWLKANDRFDVVHFTEWLGHGYYAMTAKKQGLQFQETLLCLTPHGPSLWHMLNNGDFVHRPSQLELDHMERKSVEMADVVVAPSRYLLDWMEEHGWTIPENTFVRQYVMPKAVRQRIRREPEGMRAIDELVFFGRLETRKGLVLFCDALDRLAARDIDDCRRAKITFLGKEATIAGEEAREYIARRAEAWPWTPEIVTNLDQEGALAYLEQHGRLAVIPSLADNLPNTVLECLGGQVPFLAADAGGIPEMVCNDDHARTLVPLRPEMLAQRLEEVLVQGAAPSGFEIDADENERAWVAWHEGLQGLELQPEPAEVEGDTPRVSICMPHYNRPDYLEQALRSIRDLDYPNFELIVVDDGSTDPVAIERLESLEAEFDQRGWRIIRQANAFPGAARNRAAREATGEYLFFMDDDNYAKPRELSTFVRAALRTDADVLTCFHDITTTREAIDEGHRAEVRWLALGSGPLAVGPFRNVFGDTNALVRRDVFLELGGFHEIRGVGLEDWQLWARAVLQGYRVMVVPEALFYYRSSGEGVNTTTPIHANMMQVLEPYREAHERFHPLLMLAQGMQFENRQLRKEIEAGAGRPAAQKALIAAARLMAEMGDETTASKVWSASMRMAKERRDGPAALESLLGSAELFVEMGEPEIARQSLIAAEKIAEQIGDAGTLDVIRGSLTGVDIKVPTLVG